MQDPPYQCGTRPGRTNRRSDDVALATRPARLPADPGVWVHDGRVRGDSRQAGGARAQIRGASSCALVCVATLSGSCATGPAQAKTVLFPATARSATSVIGPDGHAKMVGTQVSPVGDVDGDHRTDLLAGTPTASADGRRRAGVVRVAGFRGQAGNRRLDFRRPFLTIVGPRAGARIGGAAQSAGDANGDGRGDIVIPVRGVRPGYASFYVITGPKRGRIDLAAFASAVAHAAAPGYRVDVPVLGSVSDAQLVGDFNDDGLDDLTIARAVSAADTDNDLSDGGGPLGDAADTTTSVIGGQRRSGIITVGAPSASLLEVTGFLGTNVLRAPAGDFDHNGRDDLLFGQSSEGNACQCGPDATIIYSTRGAPSVISALKPGSRGASLANSNYSEALAGIGDTNGDRIDDVAINDGAETNILYGSKRRRIGRLNARRAAGFAFRGTVFDLSALGDITGDRLADYAPGHFIVFGSPTKKRPTLRNLGRRGLRLTDPRSRESGTDTLASTLGNVDGKAGNEVLLRTLPPSISHVEWARVVPARALVRAHPPLNGVGDEHEALRVHGAQGSGRARP